MTLLHLKALHIIFIVTWFSGLFYIVRLFIYQTEARSGPAEKAVILVPEYRRISKLLWYIISWPSAALTLVFGTSMLHKYPEWPRWLWIKVALVAALYLYHFCCHYIFIKLQKEQYPLSGSQLRIWNEVATLLLVGIVFLAVLKNALDMAYGLIGLAILAVLLMAGIKLYKRIQKR